MVSITLKNGITIEKDDLFEKFNIKNDDSKYLNLQYSKDYGFFLNVKGFWLGISELTNYLAEVDEMQQALITANEWLKKLKDNEII